MIKIKGHSGNKYNDQVDKLVKQVREESSIPWESLQSDILLTKIKWNYHIVDMSVRDFIKYFNNKIGMIE